MHRQIDPVTNGQQIEQKRVRYSFPFPFPFSLRVLRVLKSPKQGKKSGVSYKFEYRICVLTHLSPNDGMKWRTLHSPKDFYRDGGLRQSGVLFAITDANCLAVHYRRVEQQEV